MKKGHKMTNIAQIAALAATAYLGVKGVKKAEAAINPDRQVDVLARTLWGEARGEGYSGMQAVASVIMNRLKSKRNYGGTVEEVCKKPYQFSCWLKSDPNRQKLLSVNSSDRQFKTALEIAQQAVNGTLPDITGGATEYHTTKISPKWDYSKLAKTANIGNHVFYKYA